MWHQIRDNGYWQGEVWNRRKNGEEYLQRLTITCIRDMTGKITHYVGDGQDITDEKRAEADRAAIHAARRVQESLFPKSPPQLTGFDIAGAVHAASLASGDFYDFLTMGESSLGVLIADVSGHGLAPSLLMAQMQAYILALAECHDDPGDLLDSCQPTFRERRFGALCHGLPLQHPRGDSHVHLCSGRSSGLPGEERRPGRATGGNRYPARNRSRTRTSPPLPPSPCSRETRSYCSQMASRKP